MDLSDGGEATFVDLTAAGGGTFTQITDTPASRVPSAGTSTLAPFVADDNRDASVNDNASVVAFVSTRNLTGGNPDGNPEVFIYRRSPTVTMDAANEHGRRDSGSTWWRQFSMRTLRCRAPGLLCLYFKCQHYNSCRKREQRCGGFGNAEIYLASFDAVTSTAAMTRQVTRTKKDAPRQPSHPLVQGTV